MKSFKRIAVGSLLSAVTALGIAAPAQASIFHYAEYSNDSSHTISVYSGASCSGTRTSISPGHWSGYALSYKSSYATHATVYRHSGTYGPKDYHAANTCVGYPQYDDWIQDIYIQD